VQIISLILALKLPRGMLLRGCWDENGTSCKEMEKCLSPLMFLTTWEG